MIKVTKMGTHLMLTSPEKAELELMAAKLRRDGVKNISSIAPLGAHRWSMTCDDPKDRTNDCEVIRVGMQTMIKGPTREAVANKIEEVVLVGARLVAPPTEATGGGWVAICDGIDQIYKWS